MECINCVNGVAFEGPIIVHISGMEGRHFSVSKVGGLGMMPCSGCLERFGDYLAMLYEEHVISLKRVDGQFWFTYTLDNSAMAEFEYGIDAKVEHVKRTFHRLYLAGDKYEYYNICRY